VKHFRHPPETVWSALTDPSEVSAWAPFNANRNLSKTGEAVLNMVGGPEPEPLSCTVVRAEQPRLLEYTWGEDLLRWELEPTASGTRLTLSHTTGDRAWIPKVAAGWHICLDVAERKMANTPVGRIVAGEAREYGWEKLNDEYAERLQIPSTGWPSDS